MMTSPAAASRRINAYTVSSKLGLGLRPGWATLILDARRKSAFESHPWSVPDAVPIWLDDQPVLLPDVDRATPVVVYCLCEGQASSTRVARWLTAVGYQHVWVLEGGLGAWSEARQPIVGASTQARERIARWIGAPADAAPQRLLAEAAFPVTASTPVRRDLAVLFVDMVEFTPLLQRAAPEEVLALVQTFMRAVSDVAQQHCGDVRDFEGDGALLYFDSPREALPAAFDLRQRLIELRGQIAELPSARLALDYGPLIIGPLDGERRTLAFIGAAVNTAARLLKHAEPGGIIVTEAVIRHAQSHSPELAASFTAIAEPIQLKGFLEPTHAYHSTNTHGEKS